MDIGPKVYAQAQKNVAGPRQTEYLAFSEATRLLINVSTQGHNDLKSLIEAIHLNRSLWGTLAQDCASEGNMLPKETRAAIISLSHWVSNYSSDVMRERQSVDPLIEVNRMIMDGISGNVDSA